MPCSEESLQVDAQFTKDSDASLVTICMLPNEICMKDADAANWSSAVGYRPEDEYDVLHVRSVEDFCNKFTLEEAEE